LFAGKGKKGGRGRSLLAAGGGDVPPPRSAAEDPFRHLLAATSPTEGLTGSARFLRKLQCSAQPADPGVVEEPYADIMAQPSDYVHARDSGLVGAFTWTAVVGTYRRVKFLERMIESLLAQSHPPVEVWVTTFSSPHKVALEAVTRKFDAKRVKFVSGDPQLKYFGRFQLAFQAPSTHLAFFDDDCIPGSRVVENSFHTMYLKSRRYFGLIGMKGHWGNVETPGTHGQQPYHLAWEYRAPTAKAVDLTGGLWFMRRDWLHAMWRDNPFTLETGEDFQLTFTFRKYLGAWLCCCAACFFVFLPPLYPPPPPPPPLFLSRHPYVPPAHGLVRTRHVAAVARLL
jgi:hypothetical protein